MCQCCSCYGRSYAICDEHYFNYIEKIYQNNIDLVNKLYSNYITNPQYVFYKIDNFIIIMNIIDDIECVCKNNIKKYYSDKLKVILIFDETDPYKLKLNVSKYKIYEIVNSYFYLTIKDAYYVRQLYYNNSTQMQYEYNFKKDAYNIIIPVGLYQEYYESGQIKIKCNYDMYGNKNGLYQQYYENGKIDIEFNYNNNLCVNKIFHKYTDENICKSMTVDNTSKCINILYYIYYENNKIREFYNCDNNAKFNGLCKKYYENGQIKMECNYIHNIMNGSYREYYENGQIKMECYYIDDIRNGMYREYYDSGQLKIECCYIDGVKNGLFQQYYDNDQLQYKYTYIDDVLHGLYQEYYNNGDIYKKCYYNNGEYNTFEQYYAKVC